MEIPVTLFTKQTLLESQTKVISMLNGAYASEWLAYYQYWLGATLLGSGKLHDCLMEHARDELKHAKKLAARIIELGGIPIHNPNMWTDRSPCKYLTPTKDSSQLIKTNIVGEDCAIKVYTDLMAATKDSDSVTYALAKSIVFEEIEHKEELEALR